MKLSEVTQGNRPRMKLSQIQSMPMSSQEQSTHKKEFPFNVGEIIKPFMPGSPTAMMPGVAPIQAASTAYEQAKEPAIQGIENPVMKLLASVGIDVASGIGAEGAAGMIGKGMAKRGSSLISKAEGLVPRLVPPEKGVIANQIEYGGEKGYQKNLAPFVKKSKDYGELAGNFRNSEKELVGKRQGIYDDNPQIPDQQMMQPALKTLGDAEGLGVVPSSKMEQMKKLITEQVDFLNNLPKEKRLSTQFTQDRKSAFQDMAESIYGEATAPDEKIAQKMYRDFAKSNQTALEGLSPEIHGLNQKIGALIQGNKSAGKLGEKASTGQLPSLLEKIIGGTPFLNNWFPMNASKRLAQDALGRQRGVSGMSGKIESLMNRGGMYQEMENPSLIKTSLKQLARRKKNA